MSDPFFFYLLVDCPECDEEVNYGPNATLLAFRNRPVIPADLICQTRVDCPRCGAEIYFGDLEPWVEEGRYEREHEDDPDRD